MAHKNLEPVHPGRILRQEFMEPIGLSAYALAKALAVPLPRVNDIVREKRSISTEMAVLLSAYFGTSDTYWIELQARYDIMMVKDRMAKHISKIRPCRNASANSLRPTESLSASTKK